MPGNCLHPVMRTRNYRELSRIDTFEERFEYLKLGGGVGDITFGFDRWLNQQFYQSREWHNVREIVILRDNGCDLGIDGYQIHRELLVHHMNPLTPDDIAHGAEWALDPQFLITTTRRTHNAIHYGDASLLRRAPVVRHAGDTRLW